jgi:uncharacterized Zn finger protein (UPF0148 family)
MQEPIIDPKTDKVYCSICDEELPNISHFVKSQLKALKQYRQKSTTPFSVKCEHCQKEAQPVILKGQIVCPFCQNTHDQLSEPFKLMLKTILKTVNQDVS